MTMRDLAILVTLQVALLIMAVAAVHTAWSAGYDRGWADRRELDPLYRLSQFFRRVRRTLTAAARQVGGA